MAERKQEKDFSAEVKSLTSEAEDLSKVRIGSMPPSHKLSRAEWEAS